MGCEKSVIYDFEEQSMSVYMYIKLMVFEMTEQLHTCARFSEIMNASCHPKFDIVYEWNALSCCLIFPY